MNVRTVWTQVLLEKPNESINRTSLRTMNMWFKIKYYAVSVVITPKNVEPELGCASNTFPLLREYRSHSTIHFLWLFEKGH